MTHPSSSDPLRQAAASIERLRRGAAGDAPDYLTAALSRLRAAADAQGFEVGEVTLRHDDDVAEVKLSVRLSISAWLLQPFHVSEVELAETRERLKREAEANRPRYQAQDATLSALTREEYRALLEAVLAGHIEDAAADADPADQEDARLLQYEINGLCIALRLLGGYEVPQSDRGTERVAFDLDWARSIPPSSFDWRAFLGYSIEELKKVHQRRRGRVRSGAIGVPRDEEES